MRRAYRAGHSWVRTSKIGDGSVARWATIRGPASLCGVVGLMPTFGLVSRAGVIPNSYTFDHCGPLARSVEDCAMVTQAIAGFDPRDAGSLKRDIPDYRAALTRA